MDFIIFMFSILFLNDIEISLMTSGCSFVCVCVCVCVQSNTDYFENVYEDV